MCIRKPVESSEKLQGKLPQRYQGTGAGSAPRTNTKQGLERDAPNLRGGKQGAGIVPGAVLKAAATV